MKYEKKTLSAVMYKHPEELAFYTHFLIPRMGGVEMGLDCSVCVCVCLTIAQLP